MGWPKEDFSTLLLSFLALFGGGERCGFPRIGMAAHPFVVPAVEQFYVDIELIQYTGRGLIDHFIQGFGSMVKSWHRREHHSAYARE
jgi:hypothetical protein